MYSPSVHINLHVYTGLVNDLAHWVKGNFIDVESQGLAPARKKFELYVLGSNFFLAGASPCG